GRVWGRPARVGHAIAGPQHPHHFLIGRRREIDVAHQRHADFVRGLQRDGERRRAVDDRRGAAEGAPAWMPPEPPPTRTLIPTMMSRFASATCTASAGAISRSSSLSPTITVLE